MILFSKTPTDYQFLPNDYDPDDIWIALAILGIVLTSTVIIIGLV
jgi:hypothetical protein